MDSGELGVSGVSVINHVEEEYRCGGNTVIVLHQDTMVDIAKEVTLRPAHAIVMPVRVSILKMFQNSS